MSDPDFWQRWAADANAAKQSASDARAYGDAVVSYRPGGRQVVVTRERTQGDAEQKGGGVRGEITGFSAASKRRLMRVFASLRRDEKPLFLTLTYHEQEPAADRAKRDIDALAKAIARKCSASRWSFIWRMEYQKRGAIHFHLLIYGVKWMPKEWIKKAWHRITGETSKEHLEMGAWIEFVRHPGKVTRYVQKYLCKPASRASRASSSTEEQYTGRFWGVRNRKWLPRARPEKIRISWAAAYRIAADTLEEWGLDLEIIPFSLHICTETPKKWIEERLKPHERT